MAFLLQPAAFLALKNQEVPILDVRSPAEFEHAHISEALNFPLFDDEERKVIGTLYKQVSRDAAMIKGLELVGPRMADIIRNALEISPAKQIAVHCARGGKRSESTAWLLENAGFSVYLLVGGYKAIRRYYLSFLERSHFKFLVLGGRTGSRKTKMLQLLQQSGEQVLDLEGIAGHKGSAFGHLGLQIQKGYERFENRIAEHLLELDQERIVWVEAESRHIGRLMVPKAIWDQMSCAPMIFLDVSAEERLSTIMEEYGLHETHLLESAFLNIRNRIGPQHADAAVKFLKDGNLDGAAKIAMLYYDKHYDFHRQNEQKRTVFKVNSKGDSLEELLVKLLEASKKVIEK
ncbi:MAG: tRNA 2-selenouridine(34) synthase MnmH [Saprospiraceae bacterium]|jgi:tRNA 2-selenouridine synthase|nr:tRNA 2-selenouridine(34) synthase MnmH [Saprospiraceae bacterium]